MLDLLAAPLKLLETQKQKKGPGRPVSGEVCLRDVAVLETIYSCGLRISELCGLRVDDIDWSEQIVRVRGKGKKERLVPMGEPALKAIQVYWTVLLEAADGRATGFSCGHEQGRAAVPAATVTALEKLLSHRRSGSSPDPAQAAAQLRDTSAGRRRGFTKCAGTTRSRASGHDAGLYACHDGAIEAGLRRGAPAGLIGRPGMDIICGDMDEVLEHARKILSEKRG